MKIVIEVVAGRFNVTGDAVLQDKIVSLGMLELAKAAIISQPAPQAAASGIEVPNKAIADRLLNSPPGTNGHHGG